MTVIGVLPASATVESDDDLAPSERSTPDGRTPPGTAGYIVGECTVLCVECGRDHDDVHSHPDGTEPHEFDYDYFRTDSEADWPGNTCEGCHRRLPTNVLVYASGPGPDDRAPPRSSGPGVSRPRPPGAGALCS